MAQRSQGGHREVDILFEATGGTECALSLMPNLLISIACSCVPNPLERP